MNFDSEKISPVRLRLAGWTGWILIAVNLQTVSWLLRPYPSVDDMTFPAATLWVAGVLMAGWSVAGYSWNSLISKARFAFDEPEWERSKGGKNEFEKQVAFLSDSARNARYWATGLLLFGVFAMAASWGDQTAYSCSADEYGEVSCTNSLAYSTLFLLAGVVCLSLWGFYSQRFMHYFNLLEPQIREERERRAAENDSDGYIDYDA